MTGIVLRDADNVAFKVPRNAYAARMIRDEFYWMHFASRLAPLQQHVAHPILLDRPTGTLVREHIDSRENRGWGHSQRRRQLHERLCSIMRVYGFRCPEFKEDSYVYATHRGPVLVDASFSKRDLGWANARRAVALLSGSPVLDEREREDVAFGLRMDADLLPAGMATRLSKRLLQEHPG